MWVVHLALGLAALYAAIITAMYFAQTWLLFPAALAGTRQVQLPASTQRVEVRTPDGQTLVGMRIPSIDGKAEGAAPLLGFGGNAMSADIMALTLHRIYLHRDVVVFNYRGYAPSTGRPSGQALLSDSLTIFDRLQQAPASQDMIAVGFSIGSAIAAYLARHRPVTGLILVTPFDSLQALASDLYWWAPVRLLLRHHMPTIEFVRGSLAPTALIIAEHDKIVPARRSAPLRRAVSSLVFERTVDAGHNDLYDNPAFAEAMREALAAIEAVSV
jgi:pimeloyl-ACP methyl ester carboxylesterase